MRKGKKKTCLKQLQSAFYTRNMATSFLQRGGSYQDSILSRHISSFTNTVSFQIIE